MKRVPVDSTNLKSVGYDPDKKTLEVEFDKGRVYQYYGVPSALHQQLMQATESHGKFFIKHIKNAGFKFDQVS
jgi:KTSC domain